MAERWSIYLFDWRRFRAVAPELRRASESADFTDLEIPGLDELLDTAEDDLTAKELCEAAVFTLCLLDEPVVFDGGLPGLLHEMRRTEPGREPAETLAELISAGPALEPWFTPKGSALFGGILTPDRAAELAAGLRAFQAAWPGPPQPRGFAALARRFAPDEPASARLDDLAEIAAEAAARGLGLAAARTP